MEIYCHLCVTVHASCEHNQDTNFHNPESAIELLQLKLSLLVRLNTAEYVCVCTQLITICLSVHLPVSICHFCVFKHFAFISLIQEDQSHGEIVLDLEGGKIFSVAQHQNNPNLNFLCLESIRVELYHQGAHCHAVCKHLIGI